MQNQSVFPPGYNYQQGGQPNQQFNQPSNQYAQYGSQSQNQYSQQSSPVGNQAQPQSGYNNYQPQQQPTNQYNQSSYSSQSQQPQSANFQQNQIGQMNNQQPNNTGFNPMSYQMGQQPVNQQGGASSNYASQGGQMGQQMQPPQIGGQPTSGYSAPGGQPGQIGGQPSQGYQQPQVGQQPQMGGQPSQGYQQPQMGGQPTSGYPAPGGQPNSGYPAPGGQPGQKAIGSGYPPPGGQQQPPSQIGGQPSQGYQQPQIGQQPQLGGQPSSGYAAPGGQMGQPTQGYQQPGQQMQQPQMGGQPISSSGYSSSQPSITQNNGQQPGFPPTSQPNAPPMIKAGPPPPIQGQGGAAPGMGKQQQQPPRQGMGMGGFTGVPQTQPALGGAPGANRIARPNIKHSTVEQEKQSFAEYINSLEDLQKDASLQGLLPLNPSDDSLFRVCSTSTLLCKLVNSIRPTTIDESKICVKPKNIFEINNNHDLALSGARTLGCKITNVGPTDISGANPTLILAVLWQLIRIGLLSRVNLQNHPEMINLKEESENVKNFVELSPETTLLRWINHHLGNTALRRKINNLSTDIMDSLTYAYLLNQIAPHLCPLDQILQEQDPLRRAELVLQNAAKLGCRQFLSPQDIIDGNEKLNLAFIANLFNKHPALERLTVLSPEMEAQRQREVQDAIKEQIQRQEQELRQRMIDEENQLRQKLQMEEQQWRRKMEEEEQLRRKQWEAEDLKRRQQEQLLLDQRTQWELKQQQDLQNLQQQQMSWEQQQQQKLEMERQRILSERIRLEEEQRLRQQQKFGSFNPSTQMGIAPQPFQPSPATQMGISNYPQNQYGMDPMSIMQQSMAMSMPANNNFPGPGTDMGYNNNPMGGGFMQPGVGTEVGYQPGAGGFNSLSFPSVPGVTIPTHPGNNYNNPQMSYGFGPGQIPPY